MPLYEYACKQCTHEFEVLVRNAEPPRCPACDGHDLERRLSVFAAHTAGAASFDSAQGRPKVGATPGACGTCGDPRGPGTCAME